MKYSMLTTTRSGKRNPTRGEGGHMVSKSMNNEDLAQQLKVLAQAVVALNERTAQAQVDAFQARAFAVAFGPLLVSKGLVTEDELRVVREQADKIAQERVNEVYGQAGEALN